MRRQLRRGTSLTFRRIVAPNERIDVIPNAIAIHIHPFEGRAAIETGP